MIEPETRFLNQNYIGGKLTWGHPNLVSMAIGSTFSDCEIILNCAARGIEISSCVFKNCRIIAKKPQNDHQFFDTDFLGCTFVGKFPGCEFGGRLQYDRRMRRGTIAESNFRDATIHFASFSNCDFGTITVPNWPHVVFINPNETALRMPAESPFVDYKVLRKIFAESNPITKAIVVHVPTFLKKSAMTPEDFQASIAGIEGIRS